MDIEDDLLKDDELDPEEDDLEDEEEDEDDALEGGDIILPPLADSPIAPLDDEGNPIDEAEEEDPETADGFNTDADEPLI